jgi:hypothetical protein
MTDEAATIRIWTDSFVEIVKGGIDPGEAADCMLSVAGMLLARHRGTAAARLALLAGADYIARREQQEPPPERSGGLH